MHLRCDGLFKGHFITRLILGPSVKEFWKSVNICQSYGQLSMGMFFFMKHGVEMDCTTIQTTFLRVVNE